MARRPAETDDDQHETPPWMERDRAAPSRRAPDRADRNRAAEPNHTVVTWRALIIGAVLAVAVAIAGVIGVRSLIAREPAAVSGGAPGEVPLIRAPAGPYKVKPAPDSAGAGLTGDGMEGTGPATATPEEPGQASEGRIDIGSLPEAPQRPNRAPTDLLPRGVDGDVAPPGAGDAATTVAPKTEATPPTHPKAKAVPAPSTSPEAAPPRPKVKPKPKAAPEDIDAAPAPKVGKTAKAPTGQFELPPEDLAKIAPAKPAAASSATGALQLGAFSTREKAEAAWAQFTAAHPTLTHLHKRITPVDRDGTTLYRLRAIGVGDSAHLCATLKAAGEKCLVSP